MNFKEYISPNINSSNKEFKVKRQFTGLSETAYQRVAPPDNLVIRFVAGAQVDQSPRWKRETFVEIRLA